MEKLQWSALEYEERERSQDWFWALGVIIVAGALTSIIYGNYFFAALLVIGGVLLGTFAIKKPAVILYELNTQGLKMGTRLFPYDRIEAFFIQTEIKPLLFIKSQRFFLPIISMPIDVDLAPHVREILGAKEIPEEIMQEHISDKIMDSFGF